MKEFVVANLGRVFQGVEYPSRREACQARHREYVRALADGLNFTQAAHAVGVSKRTGKVWRNGRTRSSGRCERASIAPQEHWYRLYMKCQPHRVSKRFLSLKERMLIFGWRVEGFSIRDIARRLGRSPSTVSRELRRNGITSTCYNPYIAHMRAGKRLKRPKARKCADPRLWAIIWDKLQLRWSPEQICAYLRTRFPHNQSMNPCVETIYQSIFIQAKGTLRKEIASLMRQGRTRRRPAAYSRQVRPRFKDPMVMISERPASVEDRAVPGHWEGDLIIGAKGQSAVGTLVERSTRYTMLLHLPNGHTAAEVQDAIIDKLADVPHSLRLSLTWDQGSELAQHRKIASQLGLDVYFCDPHSPWQRGTNENTNGLLRQYMPKGTDLSPLTEADLDAIAGELNERPRKTLNWDTPKQRLELLLRA